MGQKDLDLSLAKLCQRNIYEGKPNVSPSSIAPNIENTESHEIVYINFHNKVTIIRFQGVSCIVQNIDNIDYRIENIVSMWSEKYLNLANDCLTMYQDELDNDTNAAIQKTLEKYNSCQGIQFTVSNLPVSISESKINAIKILANTIQHYLSTILDDEGIIVTKCIGQLDLTTMESTIKLRTRKPSK